MVSTNVITDIRQNQLSSELSLDEMILIESLSEEISVEKGQIVIDETHLSQTFYLVKSGSLNVLLGDKGITVREAGHFVGMLDLDEIPIHSVVAREPSTLIKVNVDKIFSSSRYHSLQIKLLSKVVKQLSQDVRLHEQETKKYYALGTLSVYLLCILSLYTLSLGVLSGFVANFGASTFVDISLIIGFAFVMYIFMKGSPYSYKDFGVTTVNWRDDIKEAAIITLPILLFFLILKWFLITFIPAFSEISLFNPAAALTDIGFSYPMFVFMILVYIVFSVIQEFIARTGLQSALYLFLPNSKYKLIISIVLSNLLFAMAHSHIGTLFALVAFLPGLFWGWLFARQQSIVGVSFSHMIIGIWVLFILGYTEFVQF
ncbi:CPBP family glutamic-type intramembrane protease [Halalkalibacter krulwichiae]|uniref:CAAX amino terminal protease self-immunity n=1 Tax=Halalkalibacter krulwichiae TaxID=199441 RepID=A0A1X9MIP7_9BACI|nr:CPBP family glutamic-type intramembrane protease [Halalkalibacter krulwichiae]ARK30482.1 CAAX amino terminal protease self- immunity [Halalkalibacter krulwichiae]